MPATTIIGAAYAAVFRWPFVWMKAAAVPLALCALATGNFEWFKNSDAGLNLNDAYKALDGPFFLFIAIFVAYPMFMIQWHRALYYGHIGLESRPRTPSVRWISMDGTNFYMAVNLLLALLALVATKFVVSFSIILLGFDNPNAAGADLVDLTVFVCFFLIFGRTFISFPSVSIHRPKGPLECITALKGKNFRTFAILTAVYGPILTVWVARAHLFDGGNGNMLITATVTITVTASVIAGNAAITFMLLYVEKYYPVRQPATPPPKALRLQDKER